ncbi:hypothetical protein ACFVVC_04470 [Pseudarthrobacter sp. NPDC058196]|uniref:hypothetical protein n=1 Tax=Pseudarthrobacter sp. NPDC058196 TaxID=3346376 RepID=UPI0036DDF135
MAPPIPASTKTSLQQRLTARARQRWPQLTRIQVRFRGGFAYIDALTAEHDQPLRLCRLRYAGYANRRGFAIYRASHDDYQDATLPNGLGGAAEEALDTACGLYLNDPTAWTDPDELTEMPTSVL